MTRALRLILAALLVAGLGVLGLLVTGSEPQHAAGKNRWHSSEQCKGCHADVYAEWKGSHHQIAYLNPEVRKLSDDFRNKECQSCHLPRPVLETGVGNRALPRLTRPDEGVDCLACHRAPDGSIVSKHSAPNALCSPRADPVFQGVDLCGTCHNQHHTTDQFKASRFGAEGKTCGECHMPPVTRQTAGGTQVGASHRYLGCHDKAMLLEAGVFEARLDGNEVVVSLENTGAGHNYPTEERHRAVDLMVQFVDGAGQAGAWQRAYRFRQPYRDEPGENTQLPSGEKVEARVAIPDGTALVRTRMWYRLNPYATDDQPASTLLHEKELVLP